MRGVTVRTPALAVWPIGAAGVAALVGGASAQQLAAAIQSQAVVTPDGPVFAVDDTRPLQDPSTPPPVPSTPASPADPQEVPAAAPVAGGRGAGRGGPRPYAQVITSDAKTDPGVFTVHRVGDTIFYEIPKAELGRDFL
ncbi:MAG: DUF5118 domain-containing protein [Acidobacteriota bacterium]